MRLVVAYISVVLLVAQANAQTRSGEAKLDKFIEALVTAPTLNCNYSEDGAADATVMQNPVQAVKEIVSLKGKAIPLLIQHLDDLRLTVATFDGGFSRGNRFRVPVGFVCLDILLSITLDNSAIHIRDCADDGLGACVDSRYYFRPDDYYPAGDNYLARAGVYLAKRNWQRAYKAGKLKFVYPAWWEK